ncbi:S-layer homology domain-containing protein [Sporosarcina sp. OR05]|uniref:S-layer homology domain-containing protein n=1 Tax=Sporosarcina sp. OR05 TaxID=2969819 RepID=UPI00352A58AF
MTNNSKKSKVLKSVMIGTVALTPVLAVGLNAEDAKAASNTDVTKLIDNLNLAFDKLDANTHQKALRDAHSAIKGYLTPSRVEIETDKLLSAEVKSNPSREEAAREVVGGLVELLAASTTGFKLKEEFENFNSVATDANIKKAFDNDTLSNELFVSYLVDVQANLLSNMEGTGSYKDKFIKALKDTAKSKEKYAALTIAIWDSVDVDNVGTTLDSIVTGANVQPEAKTAFVALAKEYNLIVNPPGYNGGGTGGGGGAVPPTTPPTGDTAVEVDGSTIATNPQAVIDAINNATKVEELIIKVPAGATDVNVPGTILNALDNKNSKAVVTLQFGTVSYELPVNAFDLSAAATDLDVASAELSLVVSVTKVDNPLKDKAAYKVLADAIDFEVKLVAPNDKSVTLSVFPTPIKRSLPAASTLNPLTTVGVTVDANGKVTAVPTYVSGDKSANLYRSTNSVYTLIEYSKSFADLTGGTSWAGEYVDKLASRMVVNGKTDTTFAPTLKITRGEFAAILSRGLGIVAVDPAGTSFKDVSTKQAFNQNGEISAVVEAGIVTGYKDGTFRPYEEITRDQAAIMISRAIDYVGADKVTFDKKKALTAFKDNKQIGAASRNHVERVYQAGLLDGYQDDTFRPNADANRAQMAKIIYNFLAEIEFIN